MGVVTGGGGGSLPDEWIIAPDPSLPVYGDGGVQIRLGTAGVGFSVIAPTPKNHQFLIDLQETSPKFTFISSRGAEFRVENDASTYLYGRDDGSSNPWLWFYRTDPVSFQKVVTIDFRSDAANRQTILDNDGNAIFQVRTDGSVHVKTGAATALVADL